ncbi:hypothetical protein OG196_14625 [Kitasatospora purpeofusca]|uniref:hypothetical protein n=1 Tax=Kitasatospora purpeofusca TaxID=67352 RepID=UPI002E14A6D9|nr:hypothetical protein OG196_14625 [Kitasatospora purpeofusca]
MTTILNTLNQWTPRRRWAAVGTFAAVLAAVLAVLNESGFSGRVWIALAILPALAAHRLNLLSPAAARRAQRFTQVSMMLLWAISLAWTLYLIWATRHEGTTGGGAGAVVVVALLWWVFATRSQPTTGWRESLPWRPRRAVGIHTLCMTLFLAGFFLTVRSMPTVEPTTRLTIGIGLFTAGSAFCLRAKIRTHKICTATKRAAGQLAGECRALAAGSSPDTEKLRLQIREFDVQLSAPLPTTIKLIGLPLFTRPERQALIQDLLLEPLEDPTLPARWAEAASDLEQIAASITRWADPAV